jgi:hypothetical protein
MVLPPGSRAPLTNPPASGESVNEPVDDERQEKKIPSPLELD